MAIAWDGPYCVFVHCADDSRRPWPWRLPHRRLAHYLVVVSRDGEESITVEGRQHTVACDGGYLIAPGALHTLSSPGGNRPVWVHFDVRFDARRVSHPQAGEYESELGSRSSLLQPSPSEVWDCELPVLLPLAVLPAFRAGIPRVITAWRRGSPLARLEASHEMAGMLLQLIGQMGGHDSQPASSSDRIERAEALARRSLGAEFGVDAFAAAAGYSRSRFCARYRGLRGFAPGVFLRQERMALAATLLRRPELTIGSVGVLVGYPDPTVFGRVFRACHGVGPRHWREQASISSP